MKLGVPKFNTERLYQWPGEFGRVAVPGIILAAALNLAETAFYDMNSWATFSEDWGGWRPTGASGKEFFSEFWNNSLINLDPTEASARDVAAVAGLALAWEAFKNTKK